MAIGAAVDNAAETSGDLNKEAWDKYNALRAAILIDHTTGGLHTALSSSLISDTDNTDDLGSATKEWKDLYIDGIANIDSLVADTAAISAGTITGITDLAVADGGTGSSTAATARTALGLAIGTDVEAYDAGLLSIAGLTTAADRMIYTTALDTYAVATLTAAGRAILDDANAAAQLVTLGLTATAAELNYTDGVTSAIQTQLDAKQALDAELTALAGLTSAADALPYFTGSGTAAVTTLSSYMRGIIDDANEATFKASVNLEIGTDVLAYDAGLSNLAGIAMAADKFYYTSADNTHVAGTITAFGRSIIDDADEATFKATVNLEIGTDVLAQQTIGIANDNLLEVDHVSPADDDYAKFTAAGLEGRSYTEVRTDINVEDGATADQTEAEILTLLGLTSAEVDQVGAIGTTTISANQWDWLGGYGTTAMVKAYRATSAQTISTATETKIQLNAESYDPGDNFDSTTNYRFVAPVAGYYLCIGVIRWATNTVVNHQLMTLIKQNGTTIGKAHFHRAYDAEIHTQTIVIASMAVDDYIEMDGWHNSGADCNVVIGAGDTFLQVQFLSKA